MTDAELLTAIGEIRQKNVWVYARLASLAGPVEGFRVRMPGERDVTLELIRQGLAEIPDETRALLREVAANDAEVVRLTEALARG